MKRDGVDGVGGGEVAFHRRKAVASLKLGTVAAIADHGDAFHRRKAVAPLKLVAP